MYIDGRPKATGNIAGFINSTRLVATTKKPNCIFEACEGNQKSGQSPRPVLTDMSGREYQKRSFGQPERGLPIMVPGQYDREVAESVGSDI